MQVFARSSFVVCCCQSPARSLPSTPCCVWYPQQGIFECAGAALSLCIFASMLSHRHVQIANAVLHSNIRPPFSRSCPRPIQNIITACWDKTAERRPAFSKVLDDLQACQAQISVAK